MKFKCFQSFLLFILIFCLASPSVNAELIPYYRLGMEECIQLALKNNQEIKAAGYDIETVIAKRIEATKRYVPTLEYKYRVAPGPKDLNNAIESIVTGDVTAYNQFEITLGAPITTFGKIKVGQELANLGIEIKSAQKEIKENEVVLNIYKLYNGILLARELKAVITEGLDSVGKKIKELESEDLADQLQILKLKVILYEAERRFQEADVKERVALSSMKVLMGLEPEVDFDIKSKSLNQEPWKKLPFEEVMTQAKRYRPEVRFAKEGVKLKAAEIEKAKKEYYPNLIIGAFAQVGIAPNVRNVAINNDFQNPVNYERAGIGLELSGKLDFRQLKSRVSEAKANYLKAIAQKRAAMGGLELDLKQSYLTLEQNEFLLNRAQKDQKAAQQIVFLTKSNLDLGLGERKDYLDALQSYLVFKGRAYEAIFNYNVALATIKMKTGSLYDEQKKVTSLVP
jgi:outer membrane protein